MARFNNYVVNVAELSDTQLASELARVASDYIALVDEACNACRNVDQWDNEPTDHPADGFEVTYADLLSRIERQHSKLANELKRRIRPGFRAS